MSRSSQTVFLAAFLMIGPVLPAHTQATGRLEEDQIRQLCDAAAAHEPGPLETATEADRRLFGGEPTSCMSFLYGDAEDRDYEQGRRCCLARHCNRELAMIFANGWGVPRDYDAATRFLCRAGAEELAPVERGDMLAALQAMRTSGDPKDLDYCSHVTSGVGASYCEGLTTEAEAPKLERRIAAVARPLGPEARAALADLRKAADLFAQNEADLRSAGWRGGSGHNAEFLRRRREIGEAFVGDLETFGGRRAPSASPAVFQAADRDLNAAYQAGQSAISWSEDAADTPGRPLAETLRDAQRAWLKYRNAWAAFYGLRWEGAAPPEVLGREIRTALTREREAELAD